ncbi:aminoacyl--tRNA ligase-related protein [Brevibacillus centrosporus]|uniref:tRNA synthetase class II core domain (G, H, P, S and T) n=1 Tax=Brevibacillus centrosporus TaxID=54910 RepID=A0A1I4E6P2_9BACL|nr:aminoacyl--tRNA ligase-related protein [Brevibacillus centrosporus]SFK99841.1 tRNA synthetase class II core domain (G, H, P, S and T) [Brevibacillus centrosporus]
MKDTRSYVMDLSVPKDLKNENLKEFVERIAYLSEFIQHVSYEGSKNAIRVTMENLSDEVRKQFLDSYAQLTESVNHWRLLKDREFRSNIQQHSHLFSNEETEIAECLHYDETELKILELFDQKFVKIAKMFSAQQRGYPSTLSVSSMKKNRYYNNFPQNVFSVSEIPHNYKLIEDIRGDVMNIEFNHFQSSGMFLQPCICYHCYEEWENKQLTESVLTAEGQCFRHEVSWKINQFRKSEFKMREIVFIGSEQKVISLREEILNETWEFFNKIGFVGKVINSRDPFFFYNDMKKGTFQMLSNAKYELLAMSNKEPINIASFNYCNDLLCKNYNISNNHGEYLHSGCVAFGIDRWMRVFINLYGKDPTHWPPIENLI